jgi:L-malate glycosyltransferase
MDKIKIGIVCYPTFGGSGVLATELGLGLAKQGHEIHFITYNRPVRLTSFQENVTLHEVDPVDYPLFEYVPYESSLASKLVDVVKHASLDLLHVHYAIPHASVAYLAKKILMSQGKYIPVITTLHGTDITLVGHDKSFAPVVAFGINKSDGVTAVSENLKQTTLHHFQIENEIKVIHNFVDLDRFTRVPKDHFKKAIAPEGEKILVHISNFRKVKRVSDVIEIFKRVQAKIPSKLLLIGDGPERTNLERQCRQSNICHDVRFLGKQDAIEEILAISDIFLMPSESESFGLAALEAMACEVPVISSNTGGLPEVNIEGVTGFMCDVGDVENMAKRALELLNNEDLLNQFRKNALEQAKKFSLDNILPEYENFYAEVLQKSLRTAAV